MFTRKDTRAVKGIAVIMMLFHHLAAFGDRFPVGFEGFSTKPEWIATDGYLSWIAMDANVCVTFFFFLGGYGMFKRMEENKYSLTDSILGLAKKYWRVFFIFIPIAFIFFRNSGEDLPPLVSRYDFQTKKDLINMVLSNFAILSDSLNSEWWFIQSYICAMMLGALYCRLTRKCSSFITEIFIVFGIDIMIRSVFPAISAIPAFSSLSGNFLYLRFCQITSTAAAFFMGIVMAKYNGVCRLKEIIGKLPMKPVVGLLGMAAVIWSRSYIMGNQIDVVYAPFFIVFFTLFTDSIAPLKKVLGYVGGHSTNMWLIHSFYCYYFLEVTKLVYCTDSVLIDLLVLFAMSLASSILLELIYKYGGMAAGKVKKLFPAKPAAAENE